jgi:hypothetical protein
MSARSLTKVGVVDPTSVEAMVIFQGVVLGQSLGLSKIIAEGDANVIFEALQQERKSERGSVPILGWRRNH